MRALFIGGKLAGQVLSVADGVKYVENPVPFNTGWGSERYVVGEILNARSATIHVCYIDGSDPIETILDFYAANAKGKK